MSKKIATKAAVKQNTLAVEKSVFDPHSPSGDKTWGELSSTERASFGVSLAEMFRQREQNTNDWLESLGLPRDIRLAAQVALAEYKEYATADDFDDCTYTNMIELIKVVATKKEWERRIVARSNPQSSGWPTLSPDELRKLFDIGQDTLKRRLKSQAIPNLCITTKAYRVDPTSLPDGWERTLNRG